MWETFCTGKNCVCVCVWAINISVFFHLNWQLTLCPYMQDMTLGLRVNPFYLTPWVFGRKVRNPRELQCSVNVFIPSFYPECRSCSIHAKLLLNSQALQMILLCLCDLHNIHSCWCDASQIRKSPQKWDDESLQRCTVGREDGGEGGGGGGCCLPLILFFSLWGLRWVSRLPLFLLSSCLHFWFSLALWLFLSQPFSLPLSPTPYPSLSSSLSLPGV